MSIVVNGDERPDVDPPLSVSALLAHLDVPADGRGVAVAVDAAVVPRGEWASFRVSDGARVEVLIAVQGG
jgi:sulfur carrier protein